MAVHPSANPRGSQQHAHCLQGILEGEAGSAVPYAKSRSTGILLHRWDNINIRIGAKCCQFVGKADSGKREASDPFGTAQHNF